MKRLPARKLACLVLLALLQGSWVFSAAALAQEQILAYHSDIRIAGDGSMQVTETIRVRAEGENIRRGIYREFPTRYRDRFGNAYVVDFEVTAVTRDGRPEAFNAYRRANGVRVDLGTEAFLAVPREYEYAIHYRTNRQLGFFADHDELYWNVTGNGWDFPIAEASATVTLPTAVAASALVMEGYTGGFRATGQNYSTTLDLGRATISTTRPLGRNEGLTLVLGWPKGIVAEPTRAQRMQYLLTDNRGLFIALLTLAAVVIWLGRAWTRVGRDPAVGVIFPHYGPPEGFTPALARYISNMNYDGKALTAALVNLAVQGYLQISEQGGKYLLRKLPSTRALAADEKLLYEALMAHRDVLELDNKNHAAISHAKNVHARAVKQVNQGKYFLNNTAWLAPALVGTGLSFVAVLALHALVPLAAGVYVLILLLHVLFGFLLRAPTAAGRKVMDQLEGFKLYMDVAEKDALKLRTQPRLTPELFEKFLPFAIALGVEEAWAEKFANALATMPEDRRTAYHPLWYSGHFNAARMGDFTHSVGSSFSSAISSAATPPGTASGARGGGFGGGGFSGGGGGGGGGGGR